MSQKNYPRRRNIRITFMVDEAERDLINGKMAESGINSIRAYMVKQAIEGRTITVELDSVRDMVRLLSNATNNINQIARRVNQTGSTHIADIETIRKHYEEIWGQANEVLRRLSELE